MPEWLVLIGIAAVTFAICIVHDPKPALVAWAFLTGGRAGAKKEREFLYGGGDDGWENRRQRFLAETGRADLPEGATVELCTPDTTQNAHDWGLWWWSLGEAHGGGWDGYASSEADALSTAFHMNDALTKEEKNDG